MSKLGEGQRYVGTKYLRAWPMTRGEYNAYRGWTMPEEEDPDEKGYLVEYEKESKPNHDAHAGYISWSPQDVFENTYEEVEEEQSDATG